MRLLLANHNFNEIGGSETYLLTVADQLLRLGHCVTIYANYLGRMAEVARSWRVDVIDKVDDVPQPIDVVLSQDGVVAYELAERWPRTPQVFICHSPLFELQMPPSIPGVVSAVVVMSDRVERRVRALDTRHRIVRLRQPIDVERLVPRCTARERPQKALLLGNYLSGEKRRILIDAWTSAGVEVVQIGTPAGSSRLYPEQEMAEADIIVGKGRAILDAMSCGRPAYIYDVFGTDGWVTPQAYGFMEADAFAGLALSRVTDFNQLQHDLNDYASSMGQANRELILMHHHARVHTQRLIALCQDLAPSTTHFRTTEGELARLIRANWRLEGELFRLQNDSVAIADSAAAEAASLRAELAGVTGKLQVTERAAADAVKKLRALRRSRRVRVGLTLGRVIDFFRALRKGWA